MSDLFAWVPWFRELAQKIGVEGEQFLSERAAKVDWKTKGTAPLLTHGPENVDPFSFFYYLAAKSASAASREVVYPSVGARFGTSFKGNLKDDDAFVFPVPPALTALFRDGNSFHPQLLWRLFRGAISGIEEIRSDDFDQVLKFNGVKMPKLTQALFLINPDEFLPCDAVSAFATCGNQKSVKDWTTYEAELDVVRQRFPGCDPFEINMFTYLLHMKQDPLKVTSQDWQVRTNYDETDHWPDMRDGNVVWTKDGLPAGCADPKEPRPGDAVFVRYRRQGRGIGVVLENQGGDGADRTKLQVLWLNKTPTAPGAELIPGPIHRFTSARAGKGLELANALRKEETYEPTFELLEQLGWKPPNGPIPPTPVFDLKSLADDILISESQLRKIADLLDDKKQVIFQGPPGTGKTYLAKKLAACLAGDAERVRIVQFHPSYAYEDFVQGYRPTLTEDGRGGFELRDGPLLRMAKTAEKEPDAKFFLVIDEINRGNLSKVFGELYFLLEYRDHEMQLQYGGEPFSLPPNLYLIGTMNTADRSIALVDLALRRRFHFVEFRPDKPPIEGLLGRWLDRHAQEMQWVARVVEKANEKLDDRHASIGPSYFMREGLNDAKVRMIWEHNVLPYVEERLFGQEDRLKEFDLDRLRNEAEGHPPQPENGANSDPSGAGESGNEAD